MDNELIKIEQRGGIPTCNARELWEGLKSKQQFADWIKGRIEGFVEGEDYVIQKVMNNLGGRPSTDYHLTTNMAKHCCMLEKNDIGMKYRQHFIEVEKKAKELTKPMNQFDMMRQQIQMLEDQEKRLTLVEAKLETSQREYFTIAGYASLIKRHIDVSHAAVLGRKATKMSRESDYDIGKITDQRYGECNTYHLDILKTVFMNN